jgi:hypothetical protein
MPFAARGGLSGLRSGAIVLGLGMLGLLSTPWIASAPEPSASLTTHGARLFQTEFTPEQGLGPLFNARSCVACHNEPTAGGAGQGTVGVVARVARVSDDGVDLLVGHGGPFARVHSVAELGHPCSIAPGIPADANLVSLRNASALFGLGMIDTIPDDVILAGAVPRGDGVHGHPKLGTEV